jgi:hypothetical protein
MAQRYDSRFDKNGTSGIMKKEKDPSENRSAPD